MEESKDGPPPTVAIARLSPAGEISGCNVDDAEDLDPKAMIPTRGPGLDSGIPAKRAAYLSAKRVVGARGSGALCRLSFWLIWAITLSRRPAGGGPLQGARSAWGDGGRSGVPWASRDSLHRQSLWSADARIGGGIWKS